LIFRIFFFVAIFFFTIGIWVYLLLFIVKYVVEGKEKTESEVASWIKTFLRGIWWCIVGICKLIRTIVVWIVITLKRICVRGRNFLGNFFTRYLRIFLSRCIRIFLIFVLLLAIVGFCCILSLLFGDFTITNQSFRMLFDTTISIPLILLLVVCIFWLITVFSTFSKQPIKNRYLHLGMAIVAIAGGIWIVSSCIPFINYERNVFTQVIPFTPEKEDEMIEIAFRNPQTGIGSSYTKIIPSEEFKIELSVHTITFQQQYQALIEHNFIIPLLQQVGTNSYQLYREHNQFFAEKVPYSDVNIDLIIYAPKDAKIRLANKTNCYEEGDYFRYEASKDTFVCDRRERQEQQEIELQQQLTAIYQPLLAEYLRAFQEIPYYPLPPIEEKVTRTLHTCVRQHRDYELSERLQFCSEELEKTLQPFTIEIALFTQSNKASLEQGFSLFDTPRQVEFMQHISDGLKSCIQQYASYREEEIISICSERFLTQVNLRTGETDF
jgi:hypothetical protein